MLCFRPTLQKHEKTLLTLQFSTKNFGDQIVRQQPKVLLEANLAELQRTKLNGSKKVLVTLLVIVCF